MDCKFNYEVISIECLIHKNKGEFLMDEKNLKLAQQDIDEALQTVEAIEKSLDSDGLSKDNLKKQFLVLTEKVQELEDILKTEGII